MIDRAEWEAGFIAVQTGRSWCCSRMAIEALARASVLTGGTGGRVAGPRGPDEAAAGGVSGAVEPVGALLSVRRRRRGAFGAVLARWALAPGGEAGGGGGTSRAEPALRRRWQGRREGRRG